MMLYFIIFLIGQYVQAAHQIPDEEYLVYETYDKGKKGMIEVKLEKESLGYHITYKSERFIEVILDTVNLQTIYLNKLVNGRWELSAERKGDSFAVNYRGRRKIYEEKEPIFDRHTLDFVLRGFEYTGSFKKRIRLDLPEFMVINADLEVIGEEVVSTPVGDIACWLIMMTPRIIFIKKKFYFWIEKDYPHRFVQYRDSSRKNQIVLKSYKSQL